MWEILSGSNVFIIEVTVVKHIFHLFIIRQKTFVETVFERGGAAAMFGL